MQVSPTLLGVKQRLRTEGEISLIPFKSVFVEVGVVSTDAVLLDPECPPPRVELGQWSPMDPPLEFVYSSSEIRSGVTASFSDLEGS